MHNLTTNEHKQSPRRKVGFIARGAARLVLDRPLPVDVHSSFTLFIEPL